VTVQDLLTWAHQETNTVGQNPTEAEKLLAHYCAILEPGCSPAYLRLRMRLNLLENAELPKLKLDTKEPVS
jgi:hypothetical protein